MKSLKPVRSLLTFAILTLVTGCLALTSHDDPWPCDTTADCDSNQACKGTDQGYRCVDADYCRALTADYDCENGTVCVSDHCVPGNCLYSGRCIDYVCDQSTHFCKTSCESVDDCIDEYATCVDGTCIEPECVYDSQCNGYRCVAGACTKSCKKVPDCEAGFVCVSAKCVKD